LHLSKSDDGKKQSFLRYYKVFNTSQCVNIRESLLFKSIELTDAPTTISQCEQIIEDMQNRPEITYKGDIASYDLFTDKVNVPLLKKFKDAESFYVVLFHELVPSMGHQSRLN